MQLSCFKAYDVRGRLGEELNEEIARRIGRAYGQYLAPRRVALGGDARLSSGPLKEALAEGLLAAGAEVLDLGLCGTEEVYFAVFSQGLDGGIEVTGSHNPLTDNGLKFVREESRPISNDTGLLEIKALAEGGVFSPAPAPGSRRRVSFRREYVEHLLSYIEVKNLPPLTIVCDCGHGAAGPALVDLQARLLELGAPLKFINLAAEPDGTFPQGLPNPLLPGKRARTAGAVRAHQADLGLAWDGDFDRCFFFDEQAHFIEGYYVVGLLAESFLKTQPGAAIIHDPRLYWNTIDIVHKNGGRPVAGKTGHAFIKERMRQEKAVYGGEMSAHHYFAPFAYCDSGMIPWLLVLELMGRRGRKLSELVAERQALFPCSGEINYRVADVPAVLAGIEAHFSLKAAKVDHLDGLSMEMADWRFNLRGSNTEPLLRLNLETRGDRAAVARLVAEMESLIALGGSESDR
ncbi:MAG: phosphomannomutase CpsG [Candidatus Adiutrix sp.]|jgi:phosphomannomutase/phosphomannomutase/phosphoglucomutase|nr:phosphomannomutase CpsG [Candidatus Adiutrix sp.]